MLSKEENLRPDCSELLAKTHEWTFNINNIKCDENYGEFISVSDKSENLRILRHYFNVFDHKNNVYSGKILNDLNEVLTDQTFLKKYYIELNYWSITQKLSVSYNESSIKELLETNSDFIKQSRDYIRKIEPKVSSELNLKEPDQNVNENLMPSFLKMYNSQKTTSNGSSFYNAISLILFQSEDYSNTIRLLTFDTFFRLRKQFTEYCERIGENFLKILIQNNSS